MLGLLPASFLMSNIMTAKADDVFNASEACRGTDLENTVQNLQTRLNLLEGMTVNGSHVPGLLEIENDSIKEYTKAVKWGVAGSILMSVDEGIAAAYTALGAVRVGFAFFLSMLSSTPTPGTPFVLMGQMGAGQSLITGVSVTWFLKSTGVWSGMFAGRMKQDVISEIAANLPNPPAMNERTEFKTAMIIENYLSEFRKAHTVLSSVTRQLEKKYDSFWQAANFAAVNKLSSKERAELYATEIVFVRSALLMAEDVCKN